MMNPLAFVGQRLWAAGQALLGIHPGDTDGRLSRLWGISPPASGELVTPETALGLAAYFACIRVISEDVAKLPFQVYKVGSRLEKEYDHPANRIIDVESSPDASAMAFREAVTSDALSQGNGYAEIVRNGRGQAAQLFHLNPWRIQPMLDTNSRLYYLFTNRDGTTKPYGPRDIFHLKGLGPNPYIGWPVVRVARESLGLALAQQKYGAAFYGNSASPNSAIEMPADVGKVDRDSIKEVIADWEERFQGAGKAGRVGVLMPGWKLHQYSITPGDAQYIEGRQFTTEEICRWFRIAPHKIQHLLRSTNNNIEQQSIEHVTDTLQPWLKRWEQEVDRKLFTETEKKYFYTKHNAEALLRGDSAARGMFYRTLFGMGAITINQICDKEEFPDAGKDGDRRFVPLNMIPLDLIDDWIKSKSSSAGNGLAPENDPTTDPNDPPKDQAVGDAIQFMLAGAIDRMIRKEIAAATKKASSKPKEFEAWLADFYSKHEATVRDAVKPMCQSFVLWSRACLYGAGELAEQLAAKHCETSRRLLDQANNEPEDKVAAKVQTIVNQWSNRAAEEAAEFFGGNDDVSGAHQLAV